MLSCLDWTDDVEDLPLSYNFRYIEGLDEPIPEVNQFGDIIGYMKPTENTVVDNIDKNKISALLPQGSGENNTLTVVAYILDNLGASARATTVVRVNPPDVSGDEMAAFLKNATDGMLASAAESGDPEAVFQVVKVLAGS